MAMEDSSMMSPADIAALTRGNTGFGGAVTVSLYQDGQLVPGAVQSATAAAANDMMNFAITAPVRVYRGQTSSKLQIYVNSQQVNTMNVAMEVVKE